MHVQVLLTHVGMYTYKVQGGGNPFPKPITLLRCLWGQSQRGELLFIDDCRNKGS
jgi:hypothetical protein